MRVSWKKLVKKIPFRVKVGPRKFYEIVWIDEFVQDPERMGEMRPDVKQIVIKRGLSAKETVGTLFHEFLHALAAEHCIDLSEPQVLMLEECLSEFKQFFGDLN